MGLVWQQGAWTARLQDHLGIWFEYLIVHSSFKHPNNVPYAGLGAVFPTAASQAASALAMAARCARSRRCHTSVMNGSIDEIVHMGRCLNCQRVLSKT